ncbi:hypothetical protein TB1_044377 [Malus domestica]
MSDVFEGYERHYSELSANLTKKCTVAGALDGEQKKQKVTEIKAGIDDAESLIRKMDLEARSLPPNIKAVLLAKLREYKSDLNNLKSEVKKLVSGNAYASARDELLESGMADSLTASADQRSRLMMSTERINKSSDRVKDSRRTMLETEELGVSILQDLHSQRQSLLHAHTTLHGVDDNIGKSKRVLTSMARSMNRNKWLIGTVIAVLVFVIALIFSKHKLCLPQLMRWPTNTGLASLPTRHLRSLIRACTRQSSIGVGKKLQAAIITGGLAASADSFLHNCRLHFHAAHAHAVDWTVIMGCFGHHGMLQSGLRLFVEMQSEDVKVDDVAWFACSMRVLGWAMLKLGIKDMVSQ